MFGESCTIQTGAAGTSLALTVPYTRTGLELKKETQHERALTADSRRKRRYDHTSAFLFFDFNR